MKQKHVVIVGGGIAGLSTAYALQQQAAKADFPLTCTLLESDRYWGGKILTKQVGDLVVEAGPDSFLSQKPWALELCAELGLSDRLINTNDSHKGAFVYSRGRLRRLPEGLVLVVPAKLGPLLKSGLLSLPGIARMGLDLVIPARTSGEDESLASFFSRRLGREAFERLVEPLMAGIYAGDAEQMSLRATFPRFFEMEQQRGSLIKGILAGRNARKASPAGSPARTMFVSLQGGLSELVDVLAERIRAGGGTLKLGHRVEGIEAISDPSSGHPYRLHLKPNATLSADAVVLATPAYVTADLVRELSPPAANLLSLIPYASTATVSLAYDRSAVSGAVRGFGFVVPRVEGRNLLAATWSSLKWPERAPSSQLLIRCYLGGTGRETVLTSEEDMLIRLVRHELWSLAGVSGDPQHVETNLWYRAMPQYTIGHLERLDMIHSLLGHHAGLYLTGAAYRGIGIPDCIKDGTDTAKKVVQHLSGGRAF